MSSSVARADTRTPDSVGSERDETAPRYRGTGLFIGAGLASAGSLVLSSFAAADTCEHYESCLIFAPAFSTFAGASSLLAVGLATGGGVLRGRYDHANSDVRWTRTRFLATGGSLLGIGILASVALRTVTALQPACNVDDDSEYGCALRWNRAGSMGAFAAEAVAATGGGLLGYGLGLDGPVSVAFAPRLSRGEAGLDIRVRW